MHLYLNLIHTFSLYYIFMYIHQNFTMRICAHRMTVTVTLCDCKWNVFEGGGKCALVRVCRCMCARGGVNVRFYVIIFICQRHKATPRLVEGLGRHIKATNSLAMRSLGKSNSSRKPVAHKKRNVSMSYPSYTACTQ